MLMMFNFLVSNDLVPLAVSSCIHTPKDVWGQSLVISSCIQTQGSSAQNRCWLTIVGDYIYILLVPNMLEITVS